MDNLTHSLFGLTLARTALGRAGGGTTAVLLLASNAPDIDIVATAGGALKYLEWHRGPTHGPIGVFGLGLVVAVLVWVGRRVPATRSTAPPASFLMLWALATAGATCHVLMDVPTSYGTRVLSPFDWHWFAKDWMPIVDIYLLIALAAGLLLGRSSIAARRRSAGLALAFLALNYGVRAVAHHQVLVAAPRVFGPLLPAPCDEPGGRVGTPGFVDRWPRPQRPGQSTRTDRQEQSAGHCLVEIAAMPDFVSPFHWRLIARLSSAYEMQSVNLLKLPDASRTEWRLAARHPNQWTPAVTAAARSRTATKFLAFSRFPAVSSVVNAGGDATVRWRDMRFVMGNVDGRRRQRPNIFTATVRIDREGRVVEEKFGP